MLARASDAFFAISCMIGGRSEGAKRSLFALADWGGGLASKYLLIRAPFLIPTLVRSAYVPEQNVERHGN